MGQRDSFRWPKNARGVMHDRSRDTTAEAGIWKCRTLEAQRERPPPRLRRAPITQVLDQAAQWKQPTSNFERATSRAHWSFSTSQLGRGFTSHLTYNEYPLEVETLRIVDNNGERGLDDYGWIRGNAEHAWGILN